MRSLRRPLLSSSFMMCVRRATTTRSMMHTSKEVEEAPFIIQHPRIRVETLPPSPPGTRLVVVDDVHGCLAQLRALLTRVGFSNTRADFRPTGTNLPPGRDVCVFLGDLVNRGPHSFDVVRLMMEIGAVGVMGNHELTLLQFLEKIRNNNEFSEKERMDSLYTLACTCPPDVHHFLRALPHVLLVPDHQLVVVHAGLDPTLPLAEQDEHCATKLRNLCTMEELQSHYGGDLRRADADAIVLRLDAQRRGPSTLVPIETEKCGRPWAAVWSELHDTELFVNEELRGMNVVFGHDARRGLQRYPNVVGICNGCEFGGSLSAYVLPGGEIISVPGWVREDEER